MECVHAVKDVLWEENKLCRLKCEYITQALYNVHFSV